MKASKIITAICFLIAFAGTSCSNNDNDKEQEQLISPQELHQEAKTFIEEHFSDFTIHKVRTKLHSTDEYYKVYFVERMEIEFNVNGVWTEVDGNNSAIPTSFINSAILDYLTTNYPSVPIESIDRKWYGFKVKLLNRTKLRFDQQGGFSGMDY